MRALLAQAGWLPGRDLEEALIVSRGESVGWQPNARGDSGRAVGLFQIHADPWARWCGVAPDALLDPLVNASCARKMFYEYDLARGYERWTQWSVKP